jgi:hypothetical protein
MVKGGGDTFHFDNCSSKSLVPYCQSRERDTTLKRTTFQLPKVCEQYRRAAGCGNTPYEGKGYYHGRFYSAITHKLFATLANA